MYTIVKHATHRMNADEARQLLGLAPTSSFDQAMKARDKRMERYKDDPEKSMQVCPSQLCSTQQGSAAGISASATRSLQFGCARTRQKLGCTTGCQLTTMHGTEA